MNKLIKLTAPNDTMVEVAPEGISSMYPNDGTYDHHAKTILVVAGQHQAVKETMEEVQALMDA